MMQEIFQNMQLSILAAQDKDFGHLVMLDAVSNTTGILKKVLKALQIVGFGGALVIGAACFIMLMWSGDRGRSMVKGHLGWIVVGIIGLFAVGGFATLFKNYSTSSFG